MMRKTLVVAGALAVLAQSIVAYADDTTTVQTETKTSTNPVSEIVLFPVRLVTGVIGAPIGAVTGIFTGFAKGFAWPSHTETETKTTTTHDD